LVADLHRILRADEAEVATKLSQEAANVPKERAVEVGLGVFHREAEKLDFVGILELVDGCRVKFCVTTGDTFFEAFASRSMAPDRICRSSSRLDQRSLMAVTM
jgi:hypothetical protein